MNIAIIGSGSWGVALAVHLASIGNNVKIWSFMEEERDLINNERKCKFLPGVTLSENIYCSTDFEEVIKDSKMIFNQFILKLYTCLFFNVLFWHHMLFDIFRFCQIEIFLNTLLCFHFHFLLVL